MIDDHAHPFSLGFAPFGPDEISLDVDDGPGGEERRRRAGPGRLFHELLLRSLGRLLGIAPESGAGGRDGEVLDREVVAERDRVASADWAGWVRRLYDDAEISGTILDFGVGSADRSSVGEYASLTGRPVWWLARIDPTVDDLIGAGAGAAEIVSAVETLMVEAADAGAVGYKTIAAYRTGLAVDPHASLAAADASLAQDREGLPVRRRAKPLRDLVTRTVLERAADLGRPVQFHTGFGDSEIRLAESDPLLLEELLRSPAGQAATIVLIHGSFPWHEQLAYLATVRPNLYAELSLSNLFAPLTTADRLARLVELAPRDKLLCGSDGHHLPETHWFACRTLRDAWGEVASRLAASGAGDRFVETTGRALMEDNPRAVYRLD